METLGFSPRVRVGGTDIPQVPFSEIGTFIFRGCIHGETLNGSQKGVYKNKIEEVLGHFINRLLE